MEQNDMNIISAIYTAYTLMNPADRTVVGIETFMEAYKANLGMLVNIQKTNQDQANNEEQKPVFDEQKAEDTLQRGVQKAEQTLENREELKSLLQKLKLKMKSLPMVGNVLANVPTIFKLLNSYLKGEYTDIPRSKLVLVISAACYLISPIDIIPDFIPVLGLLDDMAVVSACIKSTQKELDRYLAWREENKLAADPEE